MNTFAFKSVARLLAPLAVLAAGGCQLAYFLMPETPKSVKAEYTKLGSKKLAVVVWADRPTLDIDPKARRRVSDAIVYDLKKNLPDAKVMSPREIDEFQQNSGLDWEAMNTFEICEQLKADVILRIDLTEYTSRAGDSVELRKGRVRGSVGIYECLGPADQDPVYHTEIITNYPSAKEHRVSDLSDADLLRETVVQFGQAVARKFYDHEESLRGPANR